ncbi:hypothetical protein C8R46DRAFT_1184477 [Mycena filopes]|nr:hypothetical protein C8R46DRAFT_1184477 [Mycena filopes]
MLRQSHANETHEAIGNSDLLRKSTIIRRRAQELLDKIQPLLVPFISSEAPLPAWTSDPPPTSPGISDHIVSLQLSTVNERGTPPLVILKGLGSFMDDPILSHRVKDIFMRGKQTLLVNTSGTGKTRLLFEGLCHEWGFYVTMSRDTSHLGSADLTKFVTNNAMTMDSDFNSHLSPSSSEFEEELRYNHRHAHRRLSEALLARLLIFRMFLDIVKDRGGVSGRHKTRWLLLQLRPRLGVHADIFDRLRLSISVDVPDATETQQNISNVLVDIRSHLESDPHLFLVLDEGQAAATAYSTAFHVETGKYPLLRKILDTWESHFADGLISVVVAGTEIPSQIFDDPADAERVRWTSDTGAFDDRSLQEAYFRVFLPPEFLRSKSGAEFLDRAWRWVRGRHRFTASLVDKLLKSNFQSPQRLLDDYIRTIASFKPTDCRSLIAAESLVDFGRPYLNSMSYALLESPTYLRSKNIVLDVLFHYLTVGQPPPTFGPEEIDLVSLDYGRFINGELATVRVDEPLVLAGAAMWMSRPPPGEVDPLPAHSLLSVLRRHPPSSAKTFAKCLAFYFSRAFQSSPTLSSIFSFSTPVPAWSQQAAELVQLNLGDDGPTGCSVISSDFTGPLAISCRGVNETISWLEHKRAAPFCLSIDSNPDIIFTLRLADGSFIRVIVQATPTGDGSDLLTSLDEDNLFHDEEEPASRARALEVLNTTPTGFESSTTPTVLRVVASFEDQIVLKERPAEAPPLAALSMEMFREVMAAVTPAEFVAGVVAGALRINEPSQETERGRGIKRRNSFSAEGKEGDTGEAASKKKAASAPAPEASSRVLRPRPERKEAPAKAGTGGKGKGDVG